MQINKTENVIYLNDLESNIIKQAFIILKDNVKLDFLKNEEISKREIDIVKDAENLINYEIEKNNLKFERYKNNILSRKLRVLKASNIVMVIIIVATMLIK